MSETQLTITRDELHLCQAQMDKYDTLSASTKMWALTAWVAAAGWGISIRSGMIVLLAGIVLLLFWMLDARYKAYRENYKARRNQVGEALRHYYEHEAFPEDFRSPTLPQHQRLRVLQRMLEPHVALLYAGLLLITTGLLFNALVG